MSKAGAKVLAGAREALQYAKRARSGVRVRVPEEEDVNAIREAWAQLLPVREEVWLWGGPVRAPRAR